MLNRFHPQMLLLSLLAGWLNREQQRIVDYLREEDCVLRAKIGKNRLCLTDDERRRQHRLAVKAKAIGRKLLFEYATIVTPDTLLRWHRELIARKWTFEQKRVGRPGLMKEIARLIVKMARENPTWGYRRIQGALSELGHRVAHNTVKKVLKANGIEPAPERSKGTTWNQFLRAHRTRS